MSSVFYVNVENDDVKRDKFKSTDTFVTVTETRYNSERDIAYTAMEKTADGNIALQEVRSAEDVSSSCNHSTHQSACATLHSDVTLNYIDLDFGHKKNHSPKNKHISEKKNLNDAQLKALNNSQNKILSISQNNYLNVSPKKDSNLTESDLETKYACIDFNKTTALRQISRTKT